MDALSDVLRIVSLTGSVFMDAEFSAPWCVSVRMRPSDCVPFMPEPAQVIGYHYVVEGGLLAQIGDAAPIALKEGDIVLFPRNDIHVLGSAIERDPVRVGRFVTLPADGGLARIVYGGGGRQTRIVCGFLGSDGQAGALLETLPPILCLNVGGTPGGDWMMQTFQAATHDIARSAPGAATVLSKMAELLFIEAVRRYVATLPDEQSGWLAGLRDPAVGRALAFLHSQPARSWTTEELARAVGLSRSAFADRFTALIGQPPMHYLASWRMQVAAHRLRDARSAVAQIAYEVGYESEAAFTRAFKRHFGVPPAIWRDQPGGRAARPDKAAQAVSTTMAKE
jgi:AraC-like DNA-binding protein